MQSVQFVDSIEKRPNAPIAVTLAQNTRRTELSRKGYTEITPPDGYETALASNALYMRSRLGQIIAITATGDVAEPICVKEIVKDPS